MILAVAELRDMARATTRLAEQLDDAAGRLHHELSVDFEGPIAEEHRDALRARERDARGSAQQLREAAAALTAHADAVEHRLAQLRELEHWFGERLHEARGVLGKVAGLAHDAIDAVTGAAKDEAQRIVDAAGRAPAPYSPEWERFIAELRR